MNIESVRELNEINFTKTINEIDRDLQKIESTDSGICPKKNKITLVGGTTKLVGYKEQLPEINTPEGTDLFDIDDLLKFVPSNPVETALFQKWCWHKEYTGGRPALGFWNTLSNSILDPLSYVYEGRAKISESKSTESLEYSDDFAPNFTYDDLMLVSKSVKISLENLDRKKNNEKLKTTPQGLGSLLHLKEKIVASIKNIEADQNKDEWWAEEYKEFDNLLRTYGSYLESFNNTKLDYVTRVRSFSGAGKDDRVRHIMVSNRHLERGVDAATDIEASGKTYTVYNSVLFDLMMNIMGARLDYSIGETGDGSSAEKFDDQDMIQNTQPPLVVGLLDLNESTSLESPRLMFSDDYKEIPIYTNINKLVTRIFTRENVTSGLPNPLGFMKNYATKEFVYLNRLVEAFFGTRLVSTLQHNPYEIINQDVEISPNLAEFTDRVVESWNGDDDFLEMSKNQRNKIENDTNLSAYHIANFYKWMSLIKPKLLKKIIPLYDIDEDGNENDLTKEIFRDWEEVFCIESPPEFDGSLIYESKPLGMYQETSGTINLEYLRESLVSLGIWSDEILRAMPPMYLNTYLPIALLEHINRDKFPKSGEFIDYFIRCYIPNEHTQSLNHLDPDFDYLRIKQALEEDNLDIEGFISELRRLDLELNLHNVLIKKEAETEPVVTLRLSPKLVRYLSAVRDLNPGGSVTKITSL